MKIHVCLIAVVALAAIEVAHAADKPVSASQAALEGALRKNIDERLDALLRGDREAYRRHLLPGAVFVKGKGMDSVQDVLESLKPAVAERRGFEMASGIHVEDFGTTAVAVYLQRQTHDYGGQRFDIERGIVETFVKKPDGWLLASHVELRTPTKYPPANVDAAVAKSYVGEYSWGTCCIDKVTFEHGKLMAKLTGEDSANELKPVNATTFYIEDDSDDGVTTFEKDGQGNVTGYVYSANGHKIVATRIH